MFSFGDESRAQFGGVGVMVEPPCVDVRIEPAVRFAVTASATQRQRTTSLVAQLSTEWTLGSLPACEIRVTSPRDHTGLGVGTQLSLAVAAGLRRFLGLPEIPAEQLAMVTNRGARSAIGTHGFAQGGLIVDAGKEQADPLGRLALRTDLPGAWRFVLICPAIEEGLAGEGELLAFEKLPRVPDETTRELWAITNEQMLPAVDRRDCDAFGEAVFQFGGRAGECFAPVQGGPFASNDIAHLVASIRDYGLHGVGQSSWGPTVFAITRNDEEARRLVEWVHDRYGRAKYEIVVARPNNRGATLTI
jgi:beta-RFAP synthase